MTTAQHSHVRNGLLAALAPDDFALLAPHLREVLLVPGDLLHQPGEKIEQVYFLQTGIVSLMAVLEEGTSVETVSIGHEGAIGTIEGFGSLHAFTSARVQVSGSALRMPGPIFRRSLDESPKLKESINHYHMSVMAHVQQITACNALHDLTSRLSRILLLSADRCADDIQLSQQSLAEMLGVRRSSVTTAATLLRDDRRNRVSPGRHQGIGSQKIAKNGVRVLLDDSSRDRHGIQRHSRSPNTKRNYRRRGPASLTAVMKAVTRPHTKDSNITTGRMR